MYLGKKVKNIKKTISWKEKVMPVKINLNLGGHCIETEAKKKLKDLMDEYFSMDDPEGEIDFKIDLLREFIEKSDFRKLRTGDIRLDGEKEALVVLSRDRGGKIKMELKSLSCSGSR